MNTTGWHICYWKIPEDCNPVPPVLRFIVGQTSWLCDPSSLHPNMSNEAKEDYLNMGPIGQYKLLIPFSLEVTHEPIGK